MALLAALALSTGALSTAHAQQERNTMMNAFIKEADEKCLMGTGIMAEVLSRDNAAKLHCECVSKAITKLTLQRVKGTTPSDDNMREILKATLDDTGIVEGACHAGFVGALEHERRRQ